MGNGGQIRPQLPIVSLLIGGIFLLKAANQLVKYASCVTKGKTSSLLRVKIVTTNVYQTIPALWLRIQTVTSHLR